ncbi:MAG TPA: hypothetical protein VGK47_00605 [Nitrososphaeraceae archaeon]
MAEIEIPEGYPHREGHLPNMQVVFLDLYRLLAIFLASKRFSELADEHGLDPISQLQEPEMDEITRILISSAVTARIIDDRDNQYLSKNNTECGWLIEDLRAPEKKINLSLREACNKIIHAKTIRTDLEKQNYKSYFNPFIYFYGKYKGMDWKACVDIIEYAKKYYTYLNRA